MTRKRRPTINEAIAEVIHATGYHTLAKEWMTRPEYRSEILQAVCKIMDRDFPHRAAKFRQLVQWRHAIQSHIGEGAA